MGYLAPAAPISCSWQCHKDRNPPSSEPGTDYGTAYGTPLGSPGAGVVIDLKSSNSAATGRYVTIQLDDGNTIRCLHLSAIYVSIGQRVGRGDTIAATGASGYGSDWGYGAHVHITLWLGPAWATPTVDFALYTDEEDDMDKQDVKDAMFEFYRDVTAPPSGYTEWPFFKYAVWEYPIQAQDGNGGGVTNPDGSPVMFPASGYIASSNGIANQLKNEAGALGSKLTAPLLGVVALLELVNIAVLAVHGLS